MGELSQVESRKDRAIRHFRGERIEWAEVLDKGALRGASAGEVRDGLARSTLVDIERRGLNLVFRTDRGQALVVDLAEEADVTWTKPPTDRPTQAGLVLHFEDGRELDFVLPTARDRLYFFRTADVDREPPLKFLGPDVTTLSQDDFLLRACKYPDRTLFENVTDQAIMAGLGSAYADEICFRARIRPTRLPGTLLRDDWDRLYDALRSLLDTTLEYESDPQALETLGELAPRRGTDLGCPSCGGPLQVAHFGHRRSYCCPKCQDGEREREKREGFW